MKRTALLKHLTSMGCRLKREGGEHSIWYNPANAKQTSVPRHREIKDLLVKLICKQLEISAPN